ncbi:MAG: hypothetical protein WC943_08015, partial [Elusimicrobiota bacterium]
MTDRTGRWQGEYLRRALLEAGARLLTWPVAGAAVLVLLDRLLALPAAWRLAALILGAACWVVAAAVLVVGPLLRRDRGAVFSRAEARFPEIRPYLRSGWDLRQRPCPHTSEDLRQAHLAEADRRLDALPDENLFPWRPSAPAVSGLVAALIGCLVLWGFADRDCLQRLLAPWNDPPLESFIALSPGDRVCDHGASVSIEARWLGPPRPGGEPRLWLKGQGVPWRRTAWDSFGQAGSFVVEELTAAVEYRVTWKDLASRVYRLTPVRPPGWKSLSARIRSPQGVVTTAPLSPAEELSAYRGSLVTVLGEPTEALASAELRFAGSAPSLRMKPPALTATAAGSAGLQCSFIVAEDAVFHFELIAADGRTDPSAESYRLRALTDLPPRAELLSPAFPLQASRHDTLPIVFSASDDLGLSKVSFHVQVAAGPAREAAVLRRAPAGGPPVKEVLGDHDWSLAGLPHGAKAQFWIEAEDDAPRPQRTASGRGSVEIVDFESGHLETMRLATSSQNNLLALKAAHAAILGAVDKAAGSPPAGPELADLDRRLSGLPGAWRITAAGVSDLAASMSKDVYASPALAESMSSLADDLAAAEKAGLPGAMDSVRRRDWAEARKLHRRLGARLDAALAAFDEARRLQSLQDFHSFSGRMSRSAEALEEGVAAAQQAQTPAARAEALAGLREALGQLRAQMAQFVKDL